MTTINQLKWLAVATCIASLALPLSGAFAQGKGKGGGGGGKTSAYKIVELTHRPGNAYGINSFGDCVGDITDVDGIIKPYLWIVDSSGGVTSAELSLQTPPGQPVLPAGSAQDVNDDGFIVGYGLEPGVLTIAAFWPHALSDPVILPVPVDALRSVAYAINNNNVIVGFYVDSAGLHHPVAWAIRNNGMIAGPVEMLTGSGFRGIAQAINDAQTAVGWQAEAGNPEAWGWQLVWDGTSLSLDSGSSPGRLFPINAYVESSAHGINNDGDICGMRNPGGRAEAYFLNNYGSVLVEEPLSLLVDNKRTGSANNFARALNNNSPPQIVGEASTYSKRTGATQGFIAVLWQGSTIVDLKQGASSPSLTASPYLWAINDSGWIAGQAWTGETEIPSVPSVLIPKN